VGQKSYIKRLGIVLRAKRESLGISQEEFSFEVGLHRTYIGSIERGEKNITINSLLKIANRMGLKLSQIFKEVEGLQELEK
jgi:transcriptional regulator with XRE-family HTH domain